MEFSTNSGTLHGGISMAKGISMIALWLEARDSVSLKLGSRKYRLTDSFTFAEDYADNSQ